VWCRELAGVAAKVPLQAPLLVLGCDLVYYGGGLPDVMWTVAWLLRSRHAADGVQTASRSWAVLSFTPRLTGWMQV
jgi:hypothetical protein